MLSYNISVVVTFYQIITRRMLLWPVATGFNVPAIVYVLSIAVSVFYKLLPCLCVSMVTGPERHASTDESGD